MKPLLLTRYISRFLRHPQKNFEVRQSCCCLHSNIRTNHVNIQMLSDELHSQIFKDVKPKKLNEEELISVKEHLVKHGLWDKRPSNTEPLNFDLPELFGVNIGEHFESISRELTNRYFALAEHMSNSMTGLPMKPKQWNYKAGWTMYKVDGSSEQVLVPDEDVLIYDVEVCMKAGSLPIIATAVSKKAW